jgi:hypothetical protein
MSWRVGTAQDLVLHIIQGAEEVHQTGSKLHSFYFRGDQEEVANSMTSASRVLPQ